ncbi:nucleotidyltransferase family protein [Halanaerobacter jeridensis]|uniref:Nucleotidyltransferase n=1 Tax=Halanaerobacter jeridensis TaxID=706427 RepID=A0A938XV22_9FIRM|nr:nucleotidyltransferase domain-containing protein [Halanaerobacter jeridensis]MBM7556856.1 putative nucleotidyltransferase [Halanaerobacter jeridensis]
MDLTTYENEIQKICEEEDVSVMGVFGSVARGEERRDSDIDIIIEYNHDDKSLFDLIRFGSQCIF